MYPTLSDLLKDLLGINIPLPIQSFGLMMAIAFGVAATVVYHELKRKNEEGLLPARKKTIHTGKPATIYELAFTSLFWFIIGYKLIGAIIDYNAFTDNPQDYVLSFDGNLLAGLLAATIAFYLKWQKKKRNQSNSSETKEEIVYPQDLTGNIVLISAGFGIVGAKLFHNLENIDQLVADPVDALTSFSGLTFYGGLIFASVAVFWYAKKKNIYWKHLIDAVAPALILAYGIGRIGCQLAGDGDWGIVNNLANPGWIPDWLWASHYPHNVLNEGIPILGCEGKHCFMLAQPVFPTPVYETIMCLFIFVILWVIRKRIQIPGVLFSIYLIFNGIERFLIEQIRVNTTYHIFNRHITQAEIISTLLFITGCIGIWYFRKTRNNQLAKNIIQ
jgi:phosphatidylglycerol---prolipoprotein diacylglyceryl transferase